MPRTVPACLAIVIAFVSVASSTTKTGGNNSRRAPNTASSFEDWIAAPANLHSSFDPSSPDNWLGGTGNWSNPADWSTGLPGSSSDVTIYTGNDYVTLDTSSNINSLTLGGAGHLMSSTLIGDGNPHTLTIAGSLTINESGYLQLLNDTATAGSVTNTGFLDISNGSSLQIAGNFSNNSGALLSTGFLGGGGGNTLTIGGTLNNAYGATLYVLGAGDVANVGQLVNQGFMVIGSGTTLNLTNQPNGVTDMPLNSVWNIDGTFTAGGNNALATLTTIEGTLDLGNGQTTNITPSGGTLTLTGGLTVDSGSVLHLNGNLNNSGGGIATGILAGDNTLAIAGTLSMNSAASLQLFGQGDLVSMAMLNNSGIIDVINAGTLQVSGSVVNSGCIGQCGDVPISGGNTYNIGGTFTNQASGVFYTLADDTVNAGAVVNSGFIRLDPGTRFTAGSFSFNPGAILGIDISGPNHFGMILSMGTVALNGELYVYLDNGYTPPIGQEFKFLTFTPGALSGTFSGVNGFGENYSVIYDDSAGYVELVAEGSSGTVPEPGSFVLLGSGILAIAAVVRRKVSLLSNRDC